MKIKKPSVKGMKNCGYLGHFAQDKYIEQGHNFSGKISYDSKSSIKGPEIKSLKRVKDLSEAPMASEDVFGQMERSRQAEEDRQENMRRLRDYKEKEKMYGAEAEKRLAMRRKLRG